MLLPTTAAWLLRFSSVKALPAWRLFWGLRSNPAVTVCGLKESSLSDWCACLSKCSVTMIHFKSKWNFSLRMTYVIIFISDSMYLKVYSFPSVYALNCLQQEQPRKRNFWEFCVLFWNLARLCWAVLAERVFPGCLGKITQPHLECHIQLWAPQHKREMELQETVKGPLNDRQMGQLHWRNRWQILVFVTSRHSESGGINANTGQMFVFCIVSAVQVNCRKAISNQWFWWLQI